MHFVERFFATLTYVVSFFTLSGVEDLSNKQQAPLFGEIQHAQPPWGGPIFRPPTGRPPNLPGGDLLCDYSAMGPDWSSCSTPEDRGCWLKNRKTGDVFDIHTDYEIKKPTGVHRYYNLDLVNGSIFADGLNFTDAKYFVNATDPGSWNTKFPGPWIQACWGDTIHVNVRNNITFNGTTVHWHGIRQLNSTMMDGVPGVTQCPIAPHDNLTYSFETWQYGSSWYHSHYSVQYADGAAGPLTIHGPTSAAWDEPKFPILMNDWGHNSGFEAIWPNSGGLKFPSILLNGVGNVTRYDNTVNATSAGVHDVPDPYELRFDSRPTNGRFKRYLLRLINTSFESIFIFAIDNHLLTVVSSDFVPVQNYTTHNVTIGIGQRYNVIVTANPIPDEGGNIPQTRSFWIRTWRANCFFFPESRSQGYERAGVLRYDFETAVPQSQGWTVNTSLCADEPYNKLTPVVPWTVGKPPANDVIGGVGENLTVQLGPQGFDPGLFPLALFSMGGDDFNPLYIDYGNPIFLHLGYTGEWNPRWVVYRENYNASSWVYLLLKGVKTGDTKGAHPIHLHGHDFAILQQATGLTFPNGLNPKWDNPPRRDVVLLPTNGYVIIAFKTDNPGTWIMHCHIAYHASFGLALQIMERQSDALNIWPGLSSPAVLQTQRTCNNWNKWWGDCRNWWHNPNDKTHNNSCDFGEDFFAPDSGI